jgi:Druantia protein DruA
MNDLIAITFAGRCFSSDELALMRQAANDYAGLGITEISRTICEWLDWKRPNGHLKNHECRLLLERLRDQGVFALPALHRSGRRGPRSVSSDASSDPRTSIQTSIADLEPLQLKMVGVSTGSLFRQFIQRYHYLGYRTPVGAYLRYFVESGNGDILACLLWTSAAWKMASRDRWIGWNPDQRARNLQYIVNNGRFLILPWVHVKGLASSILSRFARHLPKDWYQHYGYRPLLLETLVDPARFAGICYRAANWICLGETSGRGRMDQHHRLPKVPKRIFVFPLRRHVQQLLCSSDPPVAPVFHQD